MTLQQLRCLCAVADSGLSVSRAAATLHMTQPGVSKMIRALENELKREIFVRSGNKLTEVTETGREALALARRIMDDRKSLLALAGEAQGYNTGTLRIGTSPLHARHGLLNPIKRFFKAYPDVDLEVLHGRPGEIVSAVASRQIDLGLSTVPDKVPTSVLTFDAYAIEYCLILPRNHPLSLRRRVTIEDIARYPLVTYSESYNSGFVVKREFQRRGLVPRVAIRAADANVVKAYVAAGLGVGVVLKMAVEPERDRDLVMVRADHIFPRSIAKFSLRREQPRRAFIYDFIQLVSGRWTREAVTALLTTGSASAPA